MRFAGSNRGKIAMIRFRSHVAKREGARKLTPEGEASTQMNSKSRHTKQIMGERGGVVLDGKGRLLDWAHPGLVRFELTDRVGMDLTADEADRESEGGGSWDSSVRVRSSPNETDITKVKGSKSLFLRPGSRKRG